ncbi:hypothetical protein COU49_02045 [Candidatus Nomurabacteria bacterium CG10_big_fil_rev_8_21_14_0_10_35_16]|uniref:Lipoprotein n=1 Tax=Candidatus Nomurabacteria bacterium CG10_big_fil_rev_8_21_14_0_10_35_16 TaxID=1974731 RepID=A0A2H0TB62_9BACT|nr:MAG: hypothetical protein COU49_02045 [Candidatus Nomurabacteria bacterium CG10_big_fil_rev_8_21_14_0_10_35_16]
MTKRLLIFIVILCLIFGYFYFFSNFFSSVISYSIVEEIIAEIKKEPIIPPLDKVAYDLKLNELANNPPVPVPPIQYDAEGNIIPPVENLNPVINLWPVETVYPNAGAILPFSRIIAYYGNLYSTKMGALGQDPEDIMLAKLDVEVKKWEVADPTTPVLPALHYIAVVAQGSAGADGKYRARMPESEIDKVLAMAEKIGAIVFLDFQVGFSTLDKELPVYEKYFKMPNVHLGIDPEFSMKGTIRPGKVVGTYDAVDVNFAIDYLSKIVQENNLTPKILVVHRYTQKMLTNYQLIKPTPEVQVVMHMDGWGEKAKKLSTYKQFIYKEPVQFTGFKLFYKNDVWEPGTVLFEPLELLKLNPIPLYIQYQ